MHECTSRENTASISLRYYSNKVTRLPFPLEVIESNVYTGRPYTQRLLNNTYFNSTLLKKCRSALISVFNKAVRLTQGFFYIQNGENYLKNNKEIWPSFCLGPMQ